MAERLTLKQAMRGYSDKVSTNKSTFAEGQGTKKILDTIGNEVIEASKYWKKNIEPNMKAWKDIEAGYDELGIDEAGRYGDGKAPNFIQRMQNPDKFEIPNVESDGQKFSASGLRGLGRATKSTDISTYESLAKSGQTDFKSLFAMQETPAVSEVSQIGYDKTTNINNSGNHEVSADSLEAPKIESNTDKTPKSVIDAHADTGGLEQPKEVKINNTLETLTKESNDVKIKKIPVPKKAEKLNNNQTGDNDDNTPISNKPEVTLTWETDTEFNAWYDEQNSNVIFSSDTLSEYDLANKKKQAYTMWLKDYKGK